MSSLRFLRARRVVDWMTRSASRTSCRWRRTSSRACLYRERASKVKPDLGLSSQVPGDRVRLGWRSCPDFTGSAAAYSQRRGHSGDAGEQVSKMRVLFRVQGLTLTPAIDLIGRRPVTRPQRLSLPSPRRRHRIPRYRCPMLFSLLLQRTQSLRPRRRLLSIPLLLLPRSLRPRCSTSSLLLTLLARPRSALGQLLLPRFRSWISSSLLRLPARRPHRDSSLRTHRCSHLSLKRYQRELPSPRSQHLLSPPSKSQNRCPRLSGSPLQSSPGAGASIPTRRSLPRICPLTKDGATASLRPGLATRGVPAAV